MYISGKHVDREIKIPNDFPMLVDFARQIDAHPDQLTEWSERYPKFKEAMVKARKLQERFLAVNSLHGLYSQAFATFTAKNVCKWRETLDLASDPENPMKFVIAKDEKDL